ncbi:hypothetical protein ABZX92_15215 [Lentzea sp. NPDC006480]|uniref:hypothetical protein n=1 Tax=Lentzea sp. NPDC006480 TaxID=3157176 RepID=UPI0033BAFEFA
MPEDRAHNTVPGTVHGPVTQIGTVHGDVHIHSAPVGPSVDVALRIASSITEPKVRTEALVQIAATVFETDPERGEQVIGLVLGSAPTGWDITSLACSIAHCAPERAALLVEPILAGTDDVGLRGSAAVALLRTRTAPDRAIPLVRVAAVNSLSEPDRVFRLVWLRRFADEIAAVDAPNAIGILQDISPDDWAHGHVSSEWIKRAITVSRDYGFALFDHYFRGRRTGDDSQDLSRKSLAIAVAGTDLYRAEAVTARIHSGSIRVDALCEMTKEVADREQAEFWLQDATEIAKRLNTRKVLGVVAAAAVKLDPALSRQLTQQVTDGASAMDLLFFADSLAAVDPAQAEQIVVRSLAMNQSHTAAWFRFMRVAKAFAEFDPARALRTLNLIEIHRDEDHARIETAEILVKIATGMAVWDAGDAKAVLNRAQQELRLVASGPYSDDANAVWRDLAETLARIDPNVVRHLAGQLSGQDHALKAMAAGVVRACASRTA